MKSDAILQMNMLSEENLNKLKKDQFLIGVLNAYLNENKLKELNSKKVNCFSLELCQGLLGLNQWIFYHHRQILQDIKL